MDKVQYQKENAVCEYPHHYWEYPIAIYLFLASYGFIRGRLAPVMASDVPAPSVTQYVNPLPAGLVLTGIVVSVSSTAIMLALTVRLYRRYHTLNIDEIAMLAKEADEA